MRQFFVIFLAIFGALTTTTETFAQPTPAVPTSPVAPTSRDPQDWTNYGRSLLRAARYRDAEIAFKRAAALSPRNLDALFEVARVSFEKGDNRAARTACRALERIDRNHPTTRACRARAALVWNRSAIAFEELEAALATDSSHYESLYALGEAHRRRTEYEQALAAFQRAASERPNAAEPHLAMGRIHAVNARRADAERAFRRALSLDPQYPEAQYELGKLIGGAEGIGLLERAAATRPTWAEVQLALGDASLGTDALRAETAYRAAIAANGALADAHTGLGRALLAQSKLADAEAALNRSLELLRNSKTAELALAEVYRRSGRPEEALERYRSAADLDPNDRSPLLLAAQLSLELGRDVLAAGYLDRILEVEPSSAAALALYGDIFRARRDLRTARQYYQRALNGQGPINRAEVQTKLNAVTEQR